MLNSYREVNALEILPLPIQLVSGAVGGNIAGSLMKEDSLGTLWNSVAGIVGGGLGEGVGGGVLMAVIGLIKKVMTK